MRHLYLIRGLPGSGKTTFAETLANALPQAVHFETDHYWYDEDGNYNWNPKRLWLAHKETEKKVLLCMMGMYGGFNDKENVIVSNTFTTEKEMEPYLGFAAQYDFKVTVLIAENRHGNISVHNVPEETMDKMAERFIPSIKLR